MKAAVLYEPLTPLVVEEVDIDEPGAGEVLVKMSASGVCHSDWHVVKGEWTHVPLPAVLGHEGAGVVEAVGPNVTRVKPGDHAILSWMPSCGVCEMCQKGWPNLCLKEFSRSPPSCACGRRARRSPRWRAWGRSAPTRSCRIWRWCPSTRPSRWSRRRWSAAA